MTAPAALGRPDALFEATPALTVGVVPTAEYLAARAALRDRPAVGPRSRSAAGGRPVETVRLPHRRGRHRPGQAQPPDPGGWARRQGRLRSADGHGWTWTEQARVGNGPAAYGRTPSPLRIARAIPPGHRRAAQAHRWLARVRETALTDFRPDAAHRRIALATVAAHHLDMATGTYAGGWDRLAHVVGVSRSTVARFLAWLRAHSLLGVVSTGHRADDSTPLPLLATLRRGPDGQPVNEAAVYVPCEPDTPRLTYPPDPGLVALDPRYHAGHLTVGDDGRVVADRSRHPRAVDEPTPTTREKRARRDPGGQPVDEPDTPMWSSGASTQHGRAHAHNCTTTAGRAGRPLRGRNNAATRQHPPEAPKPGPGGQPAGPAGPCPLCGPWPAHQPAHTRADRLRLAHQLRRISPDLAPISARLLRHLLRPWLLSQWTLTDLLHAIDHHPVTGPRQHSPTTGGPGTIHNPPGWLLTRMRDWTTPTGHPMPSHRKQTATTRAAGTYARPPAATDSTAAATSATSPVSWPPVRAVPHSPTDTLTTPDPDPDPGTRPESSGPGAGAARPPSRAHRP